MCCTCSRSGAKAALGARRTTADRSARLRRLLRQTDAIAPRALGGIHRRVGTLDQRFHALALAGDGYADRQRDLANRFASVGTVYPAARHLLPDLLCQSRSTCESRLRQQYGELVASEARGHVAALDAGLQHVRHGPNDLIPQDMPEGIVDLLEIVDIEQQQRAARQACVVSRQILESDLQATAILHTGERIEQGLALG